MKQIRLERYEEAVQRFVLDLSAEPEETLLEINGRIVARLLPIPAGNGDSNAGAEIWTDGKNARRCALIDREIDGTLTASETEELAQLQREMLQHRRRVAPLPLDDARRLHQELLSRALKDSTGAGS